jgi:hypothetical protein
MINFDTKATSNRGYLAGSAGMKGSGGSNGTKGLFSRGAGPSVYNQIDEVAFGSTAAITQFSTLVTGHDNGESGSNGQVMMTVGGRDSFSGSHSATTRIEKIAFDAGSTSSKIADLGTASYRGADASCQLYFLHLEGSDITGLTTYSNLQRISWDTGATTNIAYAFPNIEKSGAGASNDVIALMAGSSSVGNNTYIDQINFASEATSAFGQGLNIGMYARGATSNGITALFAGGAISNVGKSTVEAVAFDSLSASETWSSMQTSQQETKAISGG